MTKFLNKKNTLQDLIFAGSETSYGKTTIQGMFRSLVEPLLEQSSSEALVLLRLFDTDGIYSVIKRLEFSNVKIYSYCDNLVSQKIINTEKEDIWGNTEFLLIL